MAVSYSEFFEMFRLIASPWRKMDSWDADIESSEDDAINKVDILQDASYYDDLRNLLGDHASVKASLTSYQSAYEAQGNAFLEGDGADLIQSSNTTADAIAADLVTVMTRDSQTCLENTISYGVAYSRSGDGVVSTFTQTQKTRDDTITLTCTTAQGASDAVFSVRSKVKGDATSTVTADGSTSYADADLGISIGVSALVVGEGSGGNEWAVGDQITITTTSDERSILVCYFRDVHDVLLPTAASGAETIDNTMDDVDSSFPGAPVDGQRVVINGIRYWYSATDSGWVQECRFEEV